MGREAALGGDRVVIPDTEPAPAHPGGIVIFGKAEMVARVEPAMIGMAEAGEGAKLDHRTVSNLVSPYSATCLFHLVG
jgi:hypothetical protein